MNHRLLGLAIAGAACLSTASMAVARPQGYPSSETPYGASKGWQVTYEQNACVLVHSQPDGANLVLRWDWTTDGILMGVSKPGWSIKPGQIVPMTVTVGDLEMNIPMKGSVETDPPGFFFVQKPGVKLAYALAKGKEMSIRLADNTLVETVSLAGSSDGIALLMACYTERREADPFRKPAPMGGLETK